MSCLERVIPRPPVGDCGRKAPDTKFLDGLRGLAALLVYWHHHVLWFHYDSQQILEGAFGYHGEYRLATFPGLRSLFTGGHFAVAIFFVISGYAISIKPLQHIHSRNYSAFAKYLSSSLCRRWLRLYLPFATCTFAYLTFWHLFGIGVPRFRPKDTWSGEVRRWSSEFWQHTFVYRNSDEQWFRYNDQLWTIPFEFKSSMVVFSTLMAFSTQSTGCRLSAGAALTAYFLFVVDGWYCAMSLAGILICDLSLLAPTELPGILRVLKLAGYNFRWPILIIGLYLGGVPHFEDLSEHPRWGILSVLWPRCMSDPKWFFLFWAACITVLLVPVTTPLRRITESRLCQYLGRISFGLYLIHGLVLWAVGDGLYRNIRKSSFQHSLRNNGDGHVWNMSSTTGMLRYGPLGLEVGFLLTQVLLLPVTIVLAEAVTLFVDRPTTTLGRYMYCKTMSVEV